MTLQQSNSYPIASKRVLELLTKQKLYQQMIHAIEADAEVMAYDEQLRKWVQQTNCKSFEQGSLQFSFANFRESTWWNENMKPKVFLEKYPDFANEHWDELFRIKEGNVRVTIKMKGEK
jgi:hypothetical protein